MVIKMEQAMQYLMVLRNMPPATGKVGYAIYRNISLLDSATKEFQKMQDDLIMKYGENGRVNQDSPNFGIFITELTPLLDIECEVNLFMIDEDEMYNDALSYKDYLVLQELIVKPKEEVTVDGGRSSDPGEYRPDTRVASVSGSGCQPV